MGVLFLKYRIEHARSFSINTVKARLGLDFTFEALHTKGLRSLHITGVHASMPFGAQTQAVLDLDSCQVHLSLVDLLRGRFIAAEIAVNGARLKLDGLSLSPSDTDKNKNTLFSLDMLPSFSVVGERCAVELHFDRLDAPVIVELPAFELSGQSGGGLLSGQIQALVRHKTEEVALQLTGHYNPGSSLDAEVNLKNFDIASLRPHISLPDGLTGLINCTIHAWGNPSQMLLAETSLLVEGLSYEGLPIPIKNEEAALNALLQWDPTHQKLSVRDASLRSKLAGIDAKGSIDFQHSPPLLDFDVHAFDVPVQDVLPELLPPSIQEIGDLKLALDSNARISLAVSGSLQQPSLKADIRVPTAELSFNPKDSNFPKGELTLSGATVTWDNISAKPTGSVTIAKGEIISKAYNMSAQGLAGTLLLTEDTLEVNPLTANISDKAFVAHAAYNLKDGSISGEIAGTLTEIEKTPLHHIANNLWIGGNIGFQINGSYKPGGAVELAASMDVTQGLVAFEWWLRKIPGVGAFIKEISVSIVPGKTLKILGEAYIEDTHILGDFEYGRHEDKWKVKSIRVDVPHLEVNSAGKYINIPYTISGGSCTGGFFQTTAAGNIPGDKIDTLGGVFDEVNFLAQDGVTPLQCRDAKVQVTLDTIQGQPRTAVLSVNSAQATVPPFGETWLLPLGSDDPEYTDDFAIQYFEEEKIRKEEAIKKGEMLPEDETRTWTLLLHTDSIVMMPWEGHNFDAEVLIDQEKTAFRSCTADIGSGHAEGTYIMEKESKIATLTAQAKNIPARYPIRHLELPEILEGELSGQVTYTMNQDKPKETLHAEGDFVITQGHFLADPLRETFKHAFSDAFATLHPAALQFDRASSSVTIEGDHIHTKDLLIQMPGMKINGNGLWILDGEMDYRVDIAVTPDLAEQLPILRESFNVQGYRMTQRDIELGFRITGPTFNPVGELADLPPIGVTLVSGAAEMTGEAMKLLDTPRQMLLSIFRVGGGILGATRTQQQQMQEKHENSGSEKVRRRR